MSPLSTLGMQDKGSYAWSNHGHGLTMGSNSASRRFADMLEAQNKCLYSQ